MKGLIKIFVCVLILVACQPKPLDVKLDDYEPQVVVSSQVIPDYLMVVGLTRSFTVLSNAGFDGEGDTNTFDQVLIDSALVTIESSAGIDTLVKLSAGLYASINELETPGGNYFLNVTDYDLEKSVSASSVMLQNVPFDTVYPRLIIENEDTSIDVFSEFTDVPNQDNFYVLSIYSRNSNAEGLDVNMFFENGSNKLEYQELIEDKNNDGDKIGRIINLGDVSVQDSLMVSLSNISEGYYSFLKSRDRSGNLLSEITNEPINYPSNINGGLGYFNTHYPAIRFFDLKALTD